MLLLGAERHIYTIAGCLHPLYDDIFKERSFCIHRRPLFSVSPLFCTLQHKHRCKKAQSFAQKNKKQKEPRSICISILSLQISPFPGSARIPLSPRQTFLVQDRIREILFCRKQWAKTATDSFFANQARPPRFFLLSPPSMVRRSGNRRRRERRRNLRKYCPLSRRKEEGGPIYTVVVVWTECLPFSPPPL